ncbi:MAG TPA: lamin tail domain-containing protein [Candidatus Latescibacteria bacterium]|nr:lamin tail domain-containing protein [Candidatus Latescibacterota bacterium]
MWSALLIVVSSYATEPGDVVISEIMWMGSTASIADEWIELYNTTSTEIDLSGWQLEGAAPKGGTLVIPDGKGIPARGYFLIANYPPSSPKTMLAVEADWVTTQISLPNEKLRLVLKDSEGNVVDVADDGVGAPAAGDREGKRSMVRKFPPGDGALPDSWYTATEAWGWKDGAKEKGTPQNSRTASAEGMTWGEVKRAYDQGPTSKADPEAPEGPPPK